MISKEMKEKIKKIVKKMLPLLGTAFGAFLGFIVVVYTNNEKINMMEKSMDEISASIEAIEDMDISANFKHQDDEIADLKSDIESIRSDITSINQTMTMIAMESTKRINLADDFELESEIIEKEFYLMAPRWGQDDIIAVDLVTNESYTAKELTGKKILTSYTENGQEIYFYGQFNSNNQWDGHCIINAYKNNDLEFIMDANYDNGNITDYMQVFTDGDSWIVSDRKNEGDYNSGITYRYSKSHDYSKDFTTETVVATDVIKVADFFYIIDTQLVSYYCGNTSNGKYNDNTGDAFLVKCGKDGTVTTLYQGRFTDGYFNDNTNNAWYIVRNDNTNYMYYKGKFTGGSPIKNEGCERENNLSIDRINELMNEKNFQCDLKLKWFGEIN